MHIAKMQALQRYVPRPLAQIIGQYAAFKWCWIDGLHGDVGPRGCCCAKCATCDRPTRKPSKQGVRTITVMSTFPEGRTCYLKRWTCGAACFVRSLSNDISFANIMNKYGGVFESNHLNDHWRNYVLIYAKNMRRARRTANAIWQCDSSIVWRLYPDHYNQYVSITHKYAGKLRWGVRLFPDAVIHA